MNRDTGIRRNSVLKNCTIVAFVLALALTVCGIGAVWVFASHDKADWQLNHVELAPALEYFDANRDTLPIQAITMIDVTTDCPSALEGWEEVQNTGSLVQWRGTNLGCYHGTTVSTNTCSNDNQNGQPINPQPATDLNTWATVASTPATTPATTTGLKFCVQRIASQEWIAENMGASCDADEHPCGCHCVTLNVEPGTATVPGTQPTTYTCPISGYAFTTTAVAPPVVTGTLAWTAAPTPSYTDTNNIPTGTTTATQQYWVWLTRSVENQYQIPEMANLTVEYYGSACTNPNNHPQDPTGQYPLMASPYTGCGILGLDDFTQTVGSMNEWQFYQANDAAETVIVNTYGVATGTATTWSAQLDANLPNYETSLENKEQFTVNLLNRQIISTACTLECESFRFGTESQTILTQYGQIWNQIRLLGVVSMSCAVVALCMLTLIYIEGVRRQTQNYMTVLYAFCIVGLFLAVIYLWKAQDILTRKYLPAHSHYRDAVANDCLSGKWGQVLSSWYRHTSFNALASQLWWTLAICLILLVVGVVFAIIALMQLARKKTIPGNYHTDHQQI